MPNDPDITRRWMDGESTLDLDPEVREALLILAPQRFDVPNISVQELVSDLNRGPLAKPTKLEAVDVGAVETELVRAMFEQAAKPALDPKLSIQDILSTVRTGPLAEESRQSLDLVEESNVVAFSSAANLASHKENAAEHSKPQAQRLDGARRSARQAWWLTPVFASSLVAAAAVVVLVPTQLPQSFSPTDDQLATKHRVELVEDHSLLESPEVVSANPEAESLRQPAVISGSSLSVTNSAAPPSPRVSAKQKFPKKRMAKTPKFSEKSMRPESVVEFSTERAQASPTLAFAEPPSTERADRLAEVTPSPPTNPVDGENPIVADLLEVEDQIGSAEQLETETDYPKPRRFFERSATNRAAPNSVEAATPQEMWDGVAKSESTNNKTPSKAALFRQLRNQAAWANGLETVLSNEQTVNLTSALKEQRDGQPVLVLDRIEQRLEGAVIAGDHLSASIAIALGLRVLEDSGSTGRPVQAAQLYYALGEWSMVLGDQAQAERYYRLAVERKP